MSSVANEVVGREKKMPFIKRLSNVRRLVFPTFRENGDVGNAEKWCASNASTSPIATSEWLCDYAWRQFDRHREAVQTLETKADKLLTSSGAIAFLTAIGLKHAPDSCGKWVFLAGVGALFACSVCCVIARLASSLPEPTFVRDLIDTNRLYSDEEFNAAQCSLPAILHVQIVGFTIVEEHKAWWLNTASLLLSLAVFLVFLSLAWL